VTIHTDHKTFNDAANRSFIGRGNVISDVQYSSYIRGASTTSCNGRQYPAGDLQDTDLKPFDNKLSWIQRKRIAKHLELKDGILYVFFHYKARQKTTHCWILTDTQNAFIEGGVIGPTAKSVSVFDTMRDIITEPKSAHEAFDRLASKVLTP
jgi:hypothetical protein